MTAPKPAKPSPKVAHNSATDTSAAVDQFMHALAHPHKDVVESIRATVTCIDATIGEGIKWNAPSYRTSEYFATTNLRAKTGIGVNLHLGAKIRDLPASGIRIDDSEGLLKWLARDRAAIEFKDARDFAAKKSAFEKIVRDWIRYVQDVLRVSRTCCVGQPA